MKSHEIQYRHGPIQQSSEFKELTNPGHEVKHDLAYSVNSSWYFHPGMVLCIVMAYRQGLVNNVFSGLFINLRVFL